jgi:rod shape-determining protein MreD
MPQRPIAKKSQVLRKPASGRYIVLTFIIGLMLNLIPLGETAILIRPDFILLTIIYWIMHQPNRSGLTVAWIMGLLMDVADGVLFGQHALAYAVIGFVTLKFHRRILMFTPWQQAMHIFLLLLGALLIMLVTRLLYGSPFPGALYFAPAILGAAIWPMVDFLMVAPRQRPKPDTP